MVSQRLFKQFIAFCCDKNTELDITTMYKIKHTELFFRSTRKAKKGLQQGAQKCDVHADINQSEVEDSF